MLDFFFEIFPDVKMTHYSVSDYILLDVLAKDFGFTPASGVEPTAFRVGNKLLTKNATLTELFARTITPPLEIQDALIQNTTIVESLDEAAQMPNARPIYLGHELVRNGDGAMIGNFTKGGIDLNPANMNLQIKRDGDGVALPVDLQDIEHINIRGFVPVIIKIVPVGNLPQLLGLEPIKTLAH